MAAIIALRGHTFAELEAFKNTTWLFLFVGEAGRPLQAEPAKVRKPGDHHNYRYEKDPEQTRTRHRRALGVRQRIGVHDKCHDEERPQRRCARSTWIIGA